MSSKTTNYNLHKIDLADSPPDITVLNQNFDTIDSELKTLNNSINDLDASDVGLGNVPNVTTNNQTPTYTQASTLATLTSGEKLSVSMGKIMKAITDFISHKGSTSNPHSVTASQVGLGNVNNTSDANKPVSTAQATAIADAKSAGTTAQSNLDTHTANKSNPHGVTKSQVGLGNVPNVTTNNQTPTYTVASANAELTSGETMATAFGKIAKAISSLISHIANKSNPHGVTASQVGAVPTSRTVNGKALSSNITLSASDVGARPSTWTPTASDVGARPSTWTPTASDVGALAVNGSNQMTHLLLLGSSGSVPANDGYIGGDADRAYFGTTNSANSTRRQVSVIGADSSGKVDKSKALQFYCDGTNYAIYGAHNKPTASDVGALPSSGGSITGGFGIYGGLGYFFAESTSMTISSRNVAGDDNNRRMIHLSNSSSSLSLAEAIRLREVKAGAWTQYNLFGEHNKPNGSYTGNGSATSRTITHNGIGKVVLIFSGNGVVIVTPYGGFAINGSGTSSFIATSKLYSNETSIVMADTSALFNGSGKSYPYYVL